MQRAGMALALCGALLVAACGGRVSQEQVLAEAAEDGALGAAGADGGARTGVDPVTGSPVDQVALDGGQGSEGTGGDGTGGGTGASGATTSTLPPGGNGGATDVGVTADKIVIGNISTLSGPVPGLFRGALIGTQAWAAYINSLGGIDGRMIEVKSGDDALDTGRNRANHASLKSKVFSFVGSFSVTDEGTAVELKGTNVPDVGVPLAKTRAELTNNYAVAQTAAGWETGPARYYMQTFGPKLVKKTAFFVSAVATARLQAEREREVLESLGYEIVYSREVQANEPNYAGDVIQMRNQGVQVVMWEGQADQIADLVNAMHDQGFSVPLLNPGSTAYSQAFLDQTGAASEGARIDVSHAMFLDGDLALPEVRLFRQWMAKVDPDQDVDLFAVFGWASGRLLEQALRDAGPAITRDKVLAALERVKTFDASGLVAPSNPADKVPTNCFVVVRIHDGKFAREHPSKGFDCTTGKFQYVKE